MIGRCFALAALTLIAGWLSDNGPLLVLGFWVPLIGVGCLFQRDTRRNRNASAVLHERELRDADWKQHRAA